MRYVLMLFGAFFLLAPSMAYAENASHSPAPASAAPAQTFTDAQRAEIERIVHDYLTKTHPETLLEASEELQKREQAETDAKSKAALASARDKVFNDPNSPVGGNPKGDVTVVEFFDYQCPYCKGAQPTVEKLLKEDKGVRFVYKDFPILGPSSVLAAKAALASVKQGKYIQFNEALMKAPFSHGARPKDDEELVFKTAKEVGLNIDKLKKDMEDDSISKIIDANMELAGELGARGTPYFIVGDQVYPGAMQYDELKKAVAAARAAQKK